MLRTLLARLACLCLVSIVSGFIPSSGRPLALHLRMSAPGTSPLAMLVTVEIKPDRVDEFLRVIDIDAKGSVANENGGCLRFDVLRDQIDPCKFVFYEVYVDADAAARHREFPHFKVWTDFKTSGGVVSQTAVRADAFIYTK